MAMFDKIPKRIMLAIMLIKSLDIPIGMKIIKDLMYLWREFFIKVDIKPIIREYIISFYYKENQLIQFKTNDLKDILKVSQQIKDSRVD